MTANQLVQDGKVGALPNGVKTAEHLKAKGIVSPPLKKMILIKPGLWLEAPEFESQFAFDSWLKHKQFIHKSEYAK